MEGAVFTVMVMALDAAGEPVTQDNDEVMMQVTTSPLFNAAVEYVDELAPALPPLTCH